MSDQAVLMEDFPLARVLGVLRDARVGLAVGLAVIGLLFHTELWAAVRTWEESTAYNHCFMVIPIAAYLAWDRRTALRGLTVAPLPLAALLIPPLAIMWLAAERLGIMEGRQLAVLSMIEVLFLAVLGRRLWWALLGPLLYLYFLVPFGEFLTPRLQDITTLFIRHGVDILGIPAYIDGYVIDIPGGSFFVAEACAGLRFLIASIAFGALYALMMYRSPVRRTAFIVASIAVPIVANGFRALGIVVLGYVLGSAEAAAADHLIYGWIFFSAVILLLILIGLPFREDGRAEPANGAPMNPVPDAPRRGLIAGLSVPVLAALAPLAVMGLNRVSAAPMLAQKPLDLAPACRTTATSTPTDGGAVARALVQRVQCGDDLLDIRTEVFSARSTAAPINAERLRLSRNPVAEDTSETSVATGADDPARVWRLAKASSPTYVVAVGMWIDGQPAMPGLTTRLGMARASVIGGTLAPVLVTVTPVVDWSQFAGMKERQQLEAKLSAFLRDHPEIGDQVRVMAEAAR